ncbi:Uncharacterised protein [Vibrio cholerae]|nr:Uncharacterised protein [Vibrio cholerae]CSD29954.1 Uncharacterised protein [Vibrio cholerae]CSI76485.1 Uncharacterised protein [Vibrio cholerae]
MALFKHPRRLALLLTAHRHFRPHIDSPSKKNLAYQRRFNDFFMDC